MKRILVTGANKGIGLAIVTKILETDPEAEVLLGARDQGRGDAARESLVAQNSEWGPRVQVLPLDVSSDESVANALEELKRSFPGPSLYAIVNNAGIGIGMGDLQSVLEVNVYGIRRVCTAFASQLDPKEGRIINLTSASGPNFVSKCGASQKEFFLDAGIEWEALDGFMKECVALEGDAAKFEERGLSNGEPYGLSKACANSLTFLLARENSALLVNACTPGFIATDLTRPVASAQGKSPEDLGMKPPAEGTKSALYLLFGSSQGSGHYYGSDALRSPIDRYRSPGSPAYTGED